MCSRIPEDSYEIVEAYVRQGSFPDQANSVRTAVREKTQRDGPNSTPPPHHPNRRSNSTVHIL
ncbi:MAG: hypothetical protein ACE5Z5_12340, partial [Candidatus Bathyarchaeia archaeon]